MSIESLFLQIARDRLAPDVFQDIFDRAVVAERKRVENIHTLPKDEQITKPRTAVIIGNHLAGEPFAKPSQLPPSHVEKRMTERLDLAITPSDLGELAKFVKAGGPNVKLAKTEMVMVAHYEVSWRGKLFVAIYNKSHDRFITAFPKRKKSPKRKFFSYDGPRRAEQGLRQALRESLTDYDDC